MINIMKPLVKKVLPRRTYLPLLHFYVKLTYPFFLGNRHFCVLCEKRFRRFRPVGLSFPVLKEKHVIGGFPRKNGHCPYCHSDDRERLVYLYLKNNTDIFSRPQTILHVAPEKGLGDILRKQPHLRYISADKDGPFSEMRMDVTNIPFPDGTFDAVICNHVLEHVADDRRAIRELFRVVKPGGWAIVTVPLSTVLTETYEDLSIVTAAGRAEAFGQDDHVRIYAKDYFDRLRESGFQVECYSFVREHGDLDSDRLGLHEEEEIIIARKAVRAELRRPSERSAADFLPRRMR